MTQVIQIKPSVSALHTSGDLMTEHPVQSRNDEFALDVEDIAVIKLEAELNEHRYYLERKVEQRTVQLARRITLLESCNASLADKLAEARKEIAALRKQLANGIPSL